MEECVAAWPGCVGRRMGRGRVSGEGMERGSSCWKKELELDMDREVCVAVRGCALS